MPAVTAPATVLITGVTGYIASHAAKAFVEAGFTVVGTVRRASGGEHFERLFGTERFSYTVVEDIRTPGALDALVCQVDVIVHVAAPVVHEGQPYDARTSIEGTRNMLESAAINGSTVQRVVVTGSMTALFEPYEGPYVYSEKDWNDFAVNEAEQLGSDVPSFTAYMASKVLAERAANSFVEARKPHFDVVHVLPSFVFGPVIQDIKTFDALPSSFLYFVEYLARPQNHPKVEDYAYSFVDVRDVARALLDSTTRSDAAGTRQLAIHPKPLAVQDLYDAFYSIAEEERPTFPFEVPCGVPGAGDTHRAFFPTFARTTQDTLGWPLRDLRECMRDSFQSLYNLGILHK